MYEKFGFRTKRLSVLKAHEEDAKEISKLYRNQSAKQRRIIECNWRRELRKATEDFYRDVTFLIKDKCNKAIGLVETESEDGETVKIGIWFPNKAKESSYLNELVDAMIEWSEEEEYTAISGIQLIDDVNLSGITGTDIRGEIILSAL